MDAVSIEDANKIRAAMGLPPLPVPGADAASQSNQARKGNDALEEEDHVSTLERREAAAGSNWAKLEAEKQDKLERQKRKDAAKKQRDAAHRLAKLEGSGLGDVAGSEEQDTRSWLLGQKKRQKKIEKARLAEEQRAAKAKAEQGAYTAKDLKGVRVGHELDRLEDGEQILTLKDTGIGSESEEDELENADLLAKEKLEEKLERKKKRPVYDPNEVNEDGSQTILKQYDEEIQGKKRKRFTLDEKGGSNKRIAMESNPASTSKGIKISLDALLDDAPVQDYDEASTKVRKPKKAKKERKTRRRGADEEDDELPGGRDEQNAMDVDTGGVTGRHSVDISEEIDDEDLQAQLATQRRQALKKRKRLDVAEFAQQIREISEAPPGGDASDEEPGMVIDETREFVAHLERPGADGSEAKRRERTSADEHGASGRDADGDEEMSDQDDETHAAANVESTSDVEDGAGMVNTTGLDEEDTTTTMGSVAAMLRKRGLIDADASSSAAKKADADRRYADFLAANRTLIAEYDQRAREERERDRASGAHAGLSNMQREERARNANERREAFLASLQAKHFAANYRPDVKLEYHDEFGRNLNQKEAFKHLSHMFHGKGSGKGKLEKRLKKIEDEKRREGRGMLDGGEGGYDDIMREQGRRRGQAGVRLQ